MKILNTQQIRDWDAYTIINEPILDIDLMERAAQRLFAWIKEKHTGEESFLIFAGPGNNGGDALALARILYHAGYQNTRVVMLKIGAKLSDECFKNLNSLEAVRKVEILYCNEGDCMPEITSEDIVIDGIFGSGITRAITGYWAKVVEHINRNSFETVSIDFPSGLYGEDNLNNEGAKIEAQITLTFQFPNLAFFFADNLPYFGKWFVLDIGLHPDFMNEIDVHYFLTEKNDVQALIKQRKTFGHKGTYGHGFLIAGSYQKTGAAVLAAKACLRSGVGLVTVHVPETGREILQTAVPEAMVCIDETEMNFCGAEILQRYSAVGIGPGIGTKQSMQNALKRLLDNNSKPLVIDADALNILSENRDWLRLLPPNAILTPHVGEFDRLTHNHDTSFERYKTQLEFSKKYNVLIVLKGAYTCISDSVGNAHFNSSGNPGMATAGSGDVLTGIILSLLAQGYKPLDAARAGVFLHGLAGDLAAEQLGFEALIASDIINNLGLAFKKVKKE
ncbi:MAG: NAD(P)H-hydrate dehydratase [Salinivirgaceae bacterium]|jgi:hydroxyethylthiazole kinase-like uncharacterized protein yjeF|nr:NAD(P)H-hydrate dehydratase [Salinivirgaceae bacterium]